MQAKRTRPMNLTIQQCNMLTASNHSMHGDRCYGNRNVLRALVRRGIVDERGTLTQLGIEVREQLFSNAKRTYDDNFSITVAVGDESYPSMFLIQEDCIEIDIGKDETVSNTTMMMLEKFFEISGRRWTRQTNIDIEHYRCSVYFEPSIPTSEEAEDLEEQLQQHFPKWELN